MKTTRTDPALLRSLALALGTSPSAGGGIPSEKIIGLFSQIASKEANLMPGMLCRSLPMENVSDALVAEAAAIIDPNLPLAEALAPLYQDLLSIGFGQARKSIGSYYTPRWVVDFIVEETLGPLLAQREKAHHVRVLDPACGAGFFLTSALDFLVNRNVPIELALESCIHGCDLDPVAVMLARLSLGLRVGGSRIALEGIVENVRLGDALADRRSSDASYDAIIGNPPYLFGERVTREVRERQGDFGLAKGQFDVYWLFFEAALAGMLPDGGVYGMIVPDAVLARDDASPLRQELTRGHRLLTIAHLGQVFPGTGVSAAVVVWQKSGESAGPVRVYSVSHGVLAEQEPVDQQELAADSGCRWLVHLGSEGREALKRIESVSVPLGELVRICRGEELGSSALSRDWDAGKVPILAGRDISRLGAAVPAAFVESEKVVKPAENYAGPKLVFVKTGQGIVVTIDYSDSAALQSVYLLHVTEGPSPQPLSQPASLGLLSGNASPTAVGEGEKVSLEFLAAVLSSSVLDWVARRTFTDYKRLFPQFNQTTVKSLPIRRIEFTTPEAERGKLVAQWIALCDGGGDIAGFAGSLMPEKADVVHDVLTHLARQAIRLDQSQNKENRSRVLKQIDGIVRILYAIKPSDLDLSNSRFLGSSE